MGLQAKGEYSTQLSVPFLKRLHPDLVIDSLLDHQFIWPLAFVPFVLFLVLVIAGLSNGVNLTDGLDGLAIGCVLVSSAALTVLTYLSSNARFAEYLEIQKNSRRRRADDFLRLAGRRFARISLVQRASRGNVHGRRGFAGAGRRDWDGRGDPEAGNSAAFDRRNFHPRTALGDHSGGSFKLTGKRVFRMAPLHHHFELMGWSESKIIVRFWILALVFALFSLTTLKLR